MVAKVTRFGDGWGKWASFLRGYSRKLPDVQKAYLWICAVETGKLIKYRIWSQPSDWPALSPEWRARKVKLGLNPEMWIATAELIGMVRTIQIKKGVVFTGWTKAIHKGSRLSAAHLAMILEFGTEWIPPRPVIKWVKSQIGKIMATAHKASMDKFGLQYGI